ncbi:METTL5 family protein [Candidatus Woesearchaeota archaeon]|nr:METTL5 family protein [Candidatus Woesearchaeota archaeon]
MKNMTKSQLAIVLSKLKQLKEPSPQLEQYPTESEIAAEVLWFAYMNKDINKTIADLGCGTGLLGIGALLLGAKKVLFVDIDDKSLDVARQNLESVDKNLLKKSEFIKTDIRNFEKNADIVIQNPPFGIKLKHADKTFLETAFRTSPVIYSFHKLETRDFINKLAEKHSFKITHFWTFDWPLKQTMKYHKKRIQHIKVGCWRLEKINI